MWQKKAKKRLFFSEERTRFRLRDWAVMLAITLVYAAVAFTNLGAHEIANTYYAMDTGDDILVTFTQPEEIAGIKYFTSFGTGKFSFQYSMDGEGYHQIEWQVRGEDPTSEQAKKLAELMGNVQFKDRHFFSNKPTTMSLISKQEHVATDMYEWQFVDFDRDFRHPFTYKKTEAQKLEAKYIIIHVDKGDLQMLEMAFCDSSGAPVKVASVQSLTGGSADSGDVANLFDEQQFVPIQTYYMTEMYFDEVYHARTGYEYLTHHSIYEVTHPPLGKNILSLGIYFFGMNPFGWRFMGALFGVLMLPVMYVFGKRLFKKTLFAFIPTFLLAVDFMHYTQTRIATVDSYSVFWILLMYLFMYIYTEKNYNREPLISTLFPLALSGVVFGLGAATKWLCIYAGAGLAILLFVQLAKRFREFAYANRVLSDEAQSSALSGERRAFLKSVVRGYIPRTLVTLLWCVIFFIIVPLGIYATAYAPYLAPATEATGYMVRYAFFAFAGLLVLGLFVIALFKLRADKRTDAKAEAEAELNAAAAAAAEAAGAPALPAEGQPGLLQPDSALEADAVIHEETAKPEARPSAALKAKYRRKLAVAIVLCVLALATAGLFIYYTSFVLYTDVDQGAYDLDGILKNQEYMFNYHSKLNPDHVHPFSSKWYTWPIDYRPVFFFQGKGYTGEMMSSMSTMGNPAVWWGGIAAVLAMVVLRIRKGRFGKRTFFLSVAALSQFLPYVFITREMFIYHYFATVVFLMLLMGVLAKYLIERTKYGKTFVFIYLGVCLLLFVMFYPVTTGTVVSHAYSDVFLRWSPMWPFY